MRDSDDGSEASKYYTMALDDAAARQKIRPSSARSFEMEAQALQQLGRCQEAAEREQLSQSIALLKSSPGDPWLFHYRVPHIPTPRDPIFTYSVFEM